MAEDGCAVNCPPLKLCQ